MPVRTRVTRYKSGPANVQPPDGWVDIKHLSMNEAEEYQEAYAEPDMPYEGDPDDAAAMKAHERLVRKASFKRNAEFLAQVVLAWNWVDNQANPLPQPFENPDIFHELLDNEMVFISNCMAGQVDAAEKKETKAQRR